MATYIIGDVQGCYTSLRRLIDRFGFTPPRDRLWFVGDLVNRGPHSLEVLRWVKKLGDQATVVLGNHDLRLLALGEGVREPRRPDLLRPILEAPDREELLAWLRGRPLAHLEEGTLLVHAGVLPSWTAEQTMEIASEASRELQGPDRAAVMDRQRLQPALPWHPDLGAAERLRLGIGALTSLRTLRPDGTPEGSFKGSPEEAPREWVPWFRFPGRRSAGTTLAFGHWSALGLLNEADLIAVDTGCVWGRGLTAVRLEDRAVYHEPTAPGDVG